MANDGVLMFEGVDKSYPSPGKPVAVLHGIDLSLSPGQIVALTAPSGAGKSTLLHIAGLLDTPTRGRVLFEGKDTAQMGEQARTQARGRRIGFVYQFHHLLPELSARENAMLPLWAAGQHGAQGGARVDALLERLGVAHRASHRPAALSGGERQRVAVARALATAPSLILADEPTGSLDVQSGTAVMEALIEAARTTGSAVLLATHNPDIAAMADARWSLAAGRLSIAT